LVQTSLQHGEMAGRKISLEQELDGISRVDGQTAARSLDRRPCHRASKEPLQLETEVTKHGKRPGESLRRRQGASLNVDDPRVRHGPSDVRQGPMKREMNL